MTMPSYVLYVVVNNELKSMNPGKAQAHSGHAASQLAFEILTKPHHSFRNVYLAWADNRGFGTQMNLRPKKGVTFSNVLDYALDPYAFSVHHVGAVIDPTYPFEVDEETFSLIDSDIHTLEPKYIEKKKVYRCFREQTTAAFFFVNPDINDELTKFIKDKLELCP